EGIRQPHGDAIGSLSEGLLVARRTNPGDQCAVIFRPDQRLDLLAEPEPAAKVAGLHEVVRFAFPPDTPGRTGSTVTRNPLFWQAKRRLSADGRGAEVARRRFPRPSRSREPYLPGPSTHRYDR